MTSHQIELIQVQLLQEFNREFRELYVAEAEDAEWTRTENRILSQLGREHGYAVFCHDFGEDSIKTRWGEWLFDVCWAIETGDNWEDFRGLALVCESEWLRSRDEWMLDFMKLTVVRAPFKLFLFATNTPDEAEAAFDLFEQASAIDIDAHYLAINVPFRWDGEKLPTRSWDVRSKN